MNLDAVNRALAATVRKQEDDLKAADAEIARLRAEVIKLEEWNGEIAFNARIFADALKEIIQDSYSIYAIHVARAALEGAND